MHVNKKAILLCMSAYYRLPPADQTSDHTPPDVTVSTLLPELLFRGTIEFRSSNFPGPDYSLAKL